MSKEILENNLDKGAESLSESEPRVTFEELGCRVDRFTAGEIETDYELDPKSILSRWEKIFSAQIKEHRINKKILHQMATEFSEESKKMIEWLKSQTNSGQYEVIHFINPHSGEYITIHKRGNVKKIYGVFARFEREGVRIEHDYSFLEE